MNFGGHDFKISMPRNKAKRAQWSKQYNAVYRELHKQEIIEQKRIARMRYKIIALYVYSNGSLSCAACGESGFTKLTIDHVSGGGTRHRLRDPIANCYMCRLLYIQNFPDGYRVLCCNCNFLKHIEMVSASHVVMARHRRKLKMEALSAYSSGIKCALCPVTDDRVLTIDHVNGSGRAELRRLRMKGGADYYRYLKKNRYPDKDKLRVLCMNCNCSARIDTPPLELIVATVSSWQHGKFIASSRMP